MVRGSKSGVRKVNIDSDSDTDTETETDTRLAFKAGIV